MNEFKLCLQINNWLDALQKKFPNVVKVIGIGKSVEGRDMKLIQVTCFAHCLCYEFNYF